MGSELPALTPAQFAARLQAASPATLAPATLAALHAHYDELRRWNRRLSLVGPGTAAEVVERHYGESLAALPWLDDARRLLDVGSGGGFPGWVLAAACPRLEVTLVEARARKADFLRAAARRAGLSVHCLDARVEDAFDAASGSTFDLVTWRAVRLPEATTALLATIARRMLVWCGEPAPVPPAGWRQTRRIALPGSERRQIIEWRSGVAGN